jgi:hypothetical protein
VNGKRVHTSGKLSAQRLVHLPVTCQKSLALKIRRDQHHLEMSLRPWGYVMPTALVHYLQVLKVEPLGKLALYDVLNLHRIFRSWMTSMLVAQARMKV